MGGAPEVDSFLRTSTHKERIIRIMHKYPPFNVGLKCIQYGDTLCVGAIASTLTYFGITLISWRKQSKQSADLTNPSSWNAYKQQDHKPSLKKTFFGSTPEENVAAEKA